ncbi:hypothetical protein AVEN_181510-1 [Araneus ventricosus]|uniref:Uncharacterized protein n=1 Tax=Araneus ventricosus TaxID=182803 RepID=A0A4Y2F2T1_ARAVE|nr:hypothetical protein AVEN_181510-1 [Araneus ventricosus]
MTRVEAFSKVAERFASQQETRFLVRFPQDFNTSLFQAFQKVVKSPPSVGKIELPSSLRSRTPTEGSNPPLQSRTPTERSYPHFYSPSSDVILVNLELSGMSIN